MPESVTPSPHPLATMFGVVPARPMVSVGGITMAEAAEAFRRFGGFPGASMVPKAQTVHPSQCMVITDAPGRPKAPSKVEIIRCDHCGGGREVSAANCPHCAAPLPKPKTLQESLAQRKTYMDTFRQCLSTFPPPPPPRRVP